ncbi:MAG: hypothetical protein ACOC2K_01865 [Bacteroidota bacterium]
MRMFLYFNILLAAALLYACNGNSLTTNDDLIFPETDVTFRDHVYPFLKTKCSYQGCHGPTTPGVRTLETYENLTVDFPILVRPGEPENSRFMQYIDGTIPHRGTGFREGYITDNQIEGIRIWIKEGAVYSK